jgi:hypothetical protein
MEHIAVAVGAGVSSLDTLVRAEGGRVSRSERGGGVALTDNVELVAVAVGAECLEHY